MLIVGLALWVLLVWVAISVCAINPPGCSGSCEQGDKPCDCKGDRDAQ